MAHTVFGYLDKTMGPANHPPDNEFDLADRKSATWMKFIKNLERRLETLRRENDNNLDVAQTAMVRGRIAEIKRLLSIDAEKPEFQDSGPDY